MTKEIEVSKNTPRRGYPGMPGVVLCPQVPDKYSQIKVPRNMKAVLSNGGYTIRFEKKDS